MEKIPIVRETQADETFIAVGEKLSDVEAEKNYKQMKRLIDRQSNFIRPFIENINTINKLCNTPVQILFDKENLYIGTIE